MSHIKKCEIFSLVFFFCLIYFYSIGLQAKTFPITYDINKNNKLGIEGLLDIGVSGRNQSPPFEKEKLPNEDLNNSENGTANDLHKNTAAAIDLNLIFKWNGENNLYNFDYGAELGIESKSNTYYTIGSRIKESYVFIQKDNYGKFEIGRNIGASQEMKLGGDTLARGAGGINGQYLNYINLPMLGNRSQASGSGIISNSEENVKLPRFIVAPKHPISHAGYAKGYNNAAFYNDGKYERNRTYNDIAGDFGSTEYAPKISYYSPRIKGFKLGISYTDKAGTLASAKDDIEREGEILQVFDWGFSYVNSFNNIGLALSITGENGQFEEINSSSRKDLNSIEYGLNIIYGGFTIGSSYGNWNESLQETTGIYARDYDNNKTLANNDGSTGDNFDSAKYYTAGLAYQFGPFAASITYLESEFQENDFRATSIGMDYKWKKYAVPYIELTNFEFKSNQPQTSDIDCTSANDTEKQLKDNKGFVLLTGIVLEF